MEAATSSATTSAAENARRPMLTSIVWTNAQTNSSGANPSLATKGSAFCGYGVGDGLGDGVGKGAQRPPGGSVPLMKNSTRPK